MERVNEHDLEYRQGDSGPKYLFRGPVIDWGVLKFLPGQELGPHRHERVEETFYFATGTPKVIIDGVEHRVTEGDAYRLEPTEKHDIVNDTDRETVVIFIKSTYDPKDKVNV